MGISASTPQGVPNYYTGAGAPSGTPAAGTMYYDTTNHRAYIYDTAWCCITPTSATVPANETTTNTGFVDLATPGPAVTIVTGTRALVTLTAYCGIGSAAAISMGVDIAAPSSIAAADTSALRVTLAAGALSRVTATSLIAGLTAGSNTFTAKYKSPGGGSATFVDRVITVVGLPT